MQLILRAPKRSLAVGAHQTGLFSNATDARLAADATNAHACQPVTVAVLLLNGQPNRVKIFEENRKVLDAIALPALDGSNHSDFMAHWRRSGFRLTPNFNRGWMRSYGAVAATLGHLDALRWQVQHHVSYVLRLEDDMRIIPTSAPFLKKLLCNLTGYLDQQNGTRFSVAHFNFGNGNHRVGAEMYLTSRRGAASELRRICTRGIFDGFDFMTNLQPSTLTVGKKTATQLATMTNRASGKGSYVTKLQHFNLTSLKRESSDWPIGRCLAWSGLTGARR